MDRTIRAALVAGLIGLVGIGGIAAFLGVPATTAAISGLVAGVLFGGLILLAARRADSMAPPAGPGTSPARPGSSTSPPDLDDHATRGGDSDGHM